MAVRTGWTSIAGWQRTPWTGLRPDGLLLIETSERQSGETVRIFEQAGLLAEVVTDEELHATAVVAYRPGSVGVSPAGRTTTRT